MRYICRFIIVLTAYFLSWLMPAVAADLDQNINIALSQTDQTDNSGLTSKSRGELNGFKGYRHYRNGYRKHSDGWWYPESAFQPGAKADNASQKLRKASQNKSNAKAWMTKNHTDYCSAKYKSYAVEDNSYQPFEGPRKQCLSRYYKG